MNTENTEATVKTRRGLVFYDAQCALCRRGVSRWGNLFHHRGFRWLPLQTPGASSRLGCSEEELRREMKVLLPDGRVLGGIDAWAQLWGSVWWLWPLAFAARLPGSHAAGSKVYAWIARHRHELGALSAMNPEEVEEERSSRRRKSNVFFDFP